MRTHSVRYHPLYRPLSVRCRHSTIKPTLITSYTPTLRSAELPNRLESNFDATLWNHSCNFLTWYHRYSVYRHRIRDHTNENTTLICEKWHLLYNHSQSQLWQRERCRPQRRTGRSAIRHREYTNRGSCPPKLAEPRHTPNLSKSYVTSFLHISHFSLYTLTSEASGPRNCAVMGFFIHLFRLGRTGYLFKSTTFTCALLFVWSLLFRKIGSSFRCNSFLRKYPITPKL